MSPSIEERVAHLEGKVEEHSRGLGDIRELSVHVDQKVDAFRQELASRIDSLDQKIDRFRDELVGRIEALDSRLSSRIDALDQKLDLRMDAMDRKVSRQFTWLAGMQVALLLTVIGVLLQV